MDFINYDRERQPLTMGERLKMSIPIYGLYRAFQNDVERCCGSEKELMMWGLYQMVIDVPTILGIVYGVKEGLEVLIGK